MLRFNCVKCSYETDSTSSWNRHITTKKHLKNVGGVETSDSSRRDDLERQCMVRGFTNIDKKTDKELSTILENPDKYRFSHEVLNELKSFHDYQNIQLFCAYMETNKGEQLRTHFENILRETDVPANVLQDFYAILGIK